MSATALKRRVSELEAQAHAGWIPTRDAAGNRCWLKGSGLSTLRRLTAMQRDFMRAGLPLTKKDLPADLAEELELWSRAELRPDCGALFVMVRDAAREFLERNRT